MFKSFLEARIDFLEGAGCDRCLLHSCSENLFLACAGGHLLSPLNRFTAERTLPQGRWCHAICEQGRIAFLVFTSYFEISDYAGESRTASPTSVIIARSLPNSSAPTITNY